MAGRHSLWRRLSMARLEKGASRGRHDRTRHLQSSARSLDCLQRGMAFLVSLPPCVVHEDEHILVVNKPAGLNTHSPSPYAGEGLHEWLRNREPRWAKLAIIHRLDKATSGLIVFAKSRLANQSLTAQFAKRIVRKTYLLLISSPPPRPEFTVRGEIVRIGDRYCTGTGGDHAETRFRSLGKSHQYYALAAEPLTGRTHQIRVHASEQKLPILGDELYGGERFSRLCLHAHELAFRHPEEDREVAFRTEPDFFASPALALRLAMFDNRETSACRLMNGASDGASFYLDQWGEYF